MKRTLSEASRTLERERSREHRRIARENGLCQRCHAPAFGKSLCPKHMDDLRQERLKNGRRWEDQSAARRAEWTIRAMQGYGGKCARCGDDNLRHLEVHHKNGTGKAHRAADPRYVSSKRYQAMVEDGFPDSLELLCANCHLDEHRGQWLPTHPPK